MSDDLPDRKREYDPTKRPVYKGENRRRRRPSSSQRALRQLRGYAEPEDLTRHEHEMGEVMRKMLKKLGLQQRFDEQCVLDAWEEIAGEFAANHSRPVEMKYGVIVIQVLQSSMRYALERQKTVILKRLQDKFGRHQVKGIRFRLG